VQDFEFCALNFELEERVMQKTWLRLLMLSIAIGLMGENVVAQGLKLNGIGGRIGYFDPEQLSGTVGFGGHLTAAAGNVTLVPTVEYWGKSKNSVDFSQWSFAVDGRYHYSTESINPFVGLGLGVLITDGSVGDSSTDVGLDLLGGVDIPLNEKLALTGEAKYVMTELHSVRLSACLTYLFGKTK
jgi:hypothetical protein